MFDFLCGLFIGGNLVFIAAAMFISTRSGKISKKSGNLVTFFNNSGVETTVELVNDLRDDDNYAVVRKPDTQLEFVVSSHRLG